jgi:hypothetical protein
MVSAVAMDSCSSACMSEPRPFFFFPVGEAPNPVRVAFLPIKSCHLYSVLLSADLLLSNFFHFTRVCVSAAVYRLH